MRTGDQTRPETLLAAVNTFFADMVILPSAVLTQEERPFQPPFLTSTHRQSCSGTSRPGFLPSWGLCSAHSRLASSNRSRMEGFSGVVRSAYPWAFSNSSPVCHCWRCCQSCRSHPPASFQRCGEDCPFPAVLLSRQRSVHHFP